MAFAYENLIAEIPNYPTAGVVFQDITPVIADSDAYLAIIDHIADHFQGRGITKVIGAEARGFIIGAAVAYKLGLGLVTARKQGKLPRVSRSATYALEYGSDKLELPLGSIMPGDKVLIIDDLLATGGTCKAIAEMVLAEEAEIEGFGFFIELEGLGGRDRIAEASDAEVFSLCQRTE